ncbi:MAG: type I secretion system permease/ATPase [Gammaproteobacteria bacterium]
MEFFRQFRTHFLYAGLFSFFINLVLLVPPLYMIQVFDRVLVSRSQSTLFMLTIAAVGMLVIMVVLDSLRGVLLQSAGGMIDRLLGERVIGALIHNAAKVNRQEYVHGLRDVSLLRNFLGGASVVALFDLPWGIFFVLFTFLFHPLLGVIALLSVGTLFALTWVNEKTNRAALEKVQVDSRRAGQFIDQGLRNADVLNALGMRDAFVGRWERLNRPVLEGQEETGQRMGRINAMSKGIRQLVQVLMMAAGAWLVVADNMTPGVMLAATIILGRALAPFESLLANWNNLVAARAAYGRLKPHLEPRVLPPETRLPAPAGKLSVERVTLAGSTPDRPIIRGVVFELAAGESLAVIGPSASGKSSLARLLVGVWTPTTGAVRLDGAEIAKLDRGHIGPFLGYLPQDVELFPGTVAENIARLGEIDSEAVVRAAQYSQAHEMILRLPQGYDTVIGGGGTVLSGGQMQRIGLARALYGNPRLVVLDEPNANLDAEGEASLQQVVRRLHQDRVTLVLVTHRPSLLEHIDKVLVLRDGAQDAFGPRDEVLARVLPMRPGTQPARSAN